MHRANPDVIIFNDQYSEDEDEDEDEDEGKDDLDKPNIILIDDSEQERNAYLNFTKSIKMRTFFFHFVSSRIQRPDKQNTINKIIMQNLQKR